ncbi:urease accessory protein UreF [Streptomyces sp. HPF1205]|uniref:urease accessory protein UreF n=1 Tax=Streptomyces sp. HPF1205 TaxID=2873262 RepID=UPI001CEC7C85|nr:urease accessory UreF family protein [Streptomyces sp. HPF1205]
MSGGAGGGRAALLLLTDGRFPAGGHAHSGGAEAAVTDGRIRDAATLAAFCRGRLHTTGLVTAALAAAATAAYGPARTDTAADPGRTAAMDAAADPGRTAAMDAGTVPGRTATMDAAADTGWAAAMDAGTGTSWAAALDAAADARTPSAALRTVSRRLGRQLLRAARAVWPHPGLDALAAAFPRGAHQPVVLGVAALAAGLGPLDAAYAAAYESVGGPAAAAVRLLGLDPFRAAAVQARLAPEIDEVAAAAARAARRAAAEGPGVLPAASSPLLDIAAEQHAAWPVRLFAS